MVYDAWDADNLAQMVALAQEALQTSPLCADAYVILAQYQAELGSEQELDLWIKAVDAGERALGKDEFEEMQGHFWGFVETRPYMRARQGLATALWERGRHSEAIGHLNEMLRLNPDDNQGLRYTLMGYLVETDAEDAISQLEQSYPEEDMAMWTWPLALATYRRGGKNDISAAALKRAMTSNRHVPTYLLGDKKMPKNLPDYYSIGDAPEAIFYVHEFGDSWVKTPGALAWLRESDARGQSPRSRSRK